MDTGQIPTRAAQSGAAAASLRAAARTVPIRDERVRQIVRVAARGGGGLLGVGTAIAGVGVGLLVVQARLARRAIGPRRTVPPYADGRYLPPGATSAKGMSLRFAVLGDSSAAGPGVADAELTPAVILARGIAAAAARPVSLSNVAVVGARTRDLDAQVSRALQLRPQLAVILVGANDITHVDRPQRSVRLLVAAVQRLQLAGCRVVVGTCPDLGTIRPVAQPLRTYARRASRELAQAQAQAVVGVGGLAVKLGDLLGPSFDASPEEYFSEDRFHPSATGYAACAMVVLPAALVALGL
jgi:lysophospholipase L1-like esterase